MAVDPNIIIPSLVSGVAVVLAARGASYSKRAERNTTPNGHGPLPHAVGTIIEKVDRLDHKLGVLADLQVEHELDDKKAHAAMNRRIGALTKQVDELLP